MPNHYFQFQQFRTDQSACAVKVNPGPGPHGRAQTTSNKATHARWQYFIR